MLSIPIVGFDCSAVVGGEHRMTLTCASRQVTWHVSTFTFVTLISSSSYELYAGSLLLLALRNVAFNLCCKASWGGHFPQSIPHLIAYTGIVPWLSWLLWRSLLSTLWIVLLMCQIDRVLQLLWYIAQPWNHPTFKFFFFLFCFCNKTHRGSITFQVNCNRDRFPALLSTRLLWLFLYSKKDQLMLQTDLVNTYGGLFRSGWWKIFLTKFKC